MRAGLAILGFLFASIPSSVVYATQDKSQIPADAELKKAEKGIRDLFATEYKAKDRATKRALAQKLLSQAPGTSNLAERFVLLRESRDLGAEALDFDTAFGAADKLGDQFQGQAPLTGATFSASYNKLEALNTAKRTPLTPDEMAAVAAHYLRVAVLAIKSAEYETATKAGQGAEQAAKSANDANLSKRAGELLKEIPLWKIEDEASTKAAKAMAEGEVPENCTILGKFQFFAKEDREGLKLLVKGSDAAMKAAASKELESAGTDAMPDIAEAWWSAAESQKNSLDKRRCQNHAFSLLDSALPSAAGLTRTKIEKRMEEWEQVLTGLPWIDLLRSMTPKDAVLGIWPVTPAGVATPPWEDQACHRAQIPFEPPLEYDIKATVESKKGGWFGVGLVAGGKQSVVQLKDIPVGKVVSLRIQVRRSGYSFIVDGKPHTDYKGDFSDVPGVGPRWVMPNPKSLFLQSGGSYAFSTLKLRQVSGQGKKLR